MGVRTGLSFWFVSFNTEKPDKLQVKMAPLSFKFKSKLGSEAFTD